MSFWKGESENNFYVIFFFMKENPLWMEYAWQTFLTVSDAAYFLCVLRISKCKAHFCDRFATAKMGIQIF